MPLSFPLPSARLESCPNGRPPQKEFRLLSLGNNLLQLRGHFAARDFDDRHFAALVHDDLILFAPLGFRLWKIEAAVRSAAFACGRARACVHASETTSILWTSRERCQPGLKRREPSTRICFARSFSLSSSTSASRRSASMRKIPTRFCMTCPANLRESRRDFRLRCD